MSGVNMDRLGYNEMRKHVQRGDTIMVWWLDRFGRSMRCLVGHIYALLDQGINFVSLTENIDLSTATGELILGVLASVASFERALIVERTREGMISAKKRGSLIGRPQALNGEEFMKAQFLLNQGMSVRQVSQHFGIGRNTLYSYLQGLRDLETLNTHPI